jgi:hypothetical protein
VTQEKTERERFPVDPLLHNRERRRASLIMAIMGFFVILATAAVFTGDRFTLFFLTTLQNHNQKGFHQSQWISQV